MLFNKWIVAVLIATSIMSVAQAEESQTNTGIANVMFMDSNMFDNRLAGEMEKKSAKIEIAVTGKVSINQMPGRLDRWLTRVSEHGEVAIKPVEPVVGQSRSIFFLAPLFSIFNNGKDAIGKISAERGLARSEDYNATVFCETGPDGEVVIKKVVLLRKLESGK